MNFTGNAVCGLTGWDQRTPEELGTPIAKKNFTPPFSRKRQGESQMTRIPRTSRTMFKGSNQGFQTRCLGHRHDEVVITECQSESSHFVKRYFKLPSQVTDTILTNTVVGVSISICPCKTASILPHLYKGHTDGLPQSSSQLD